MSVISPKRVILFLAAALAAVPMLANHPSPRIQPRMAFDVKEGIGVLFGGSVPTDSATGLTHAATETWVWVNSQWIQVFPATVPPARSAHAMVYDSRRGRVLMFGGRKQSGELSGKAAAFDDLWAWHDGNWELIQTATHPVAREFPGLAYDADRDRVILFGGYDYGEDGKSLNPRKDTWEFDGTDWTQVSDNGPESLKPVLQFDPVHHETIMLGSLSTALEPVMFRWNVASKTWDSIKPTTLPPCAFDGSLTWDPVASRLLAAGGVCSTDTSLLDETYAWDGTDWTKLVTSATSRLTGAAVAYDTAASQLVRFGGSSNFGQTIESSTVILDGLDWRYSSSSNAAPGPRSRPLFVRDPDRDTIWLYGGLSEFSFNSASAFYLGDFWKYSNGHWNRAEGATTLTPGGCNAPAAAYDTDRQLLVVVCDGNDVFEWNGIEWKTSTVTKHPDARRFFGAVYEPNLKKTLIFGGYDSLGNYRNDTWTWDGTAWTELKPKDKPENRGQMSMWYDPLAKKTIVYSGVGRPNIDKHVTRFEDMWAFDGTNWAKVTMSGPTPGVRFGAQVALDPRDNKVLLFGGLRAIVDPKDSNNVDQFYTNDLWQWDGAASKWTEINTGNRPFRRQNGAFEFDSASGKFVLFGGFAGNFYLSDTWLWDGQNWTAVQASPVARRRASRK